MVSTLLLSWLAACPGSAEKSSGDSGPSPGTAPDSSDSATPADSADSADSPPLDTGTTSRTDADGDGYGAAAEGGLDCDDADDLVHPGAPELCDDGDQDCDGDGWAGADCSASHHGQSLGWVRVQNPYAPVIVRDVTGDGVDDIGYFRPDVTDSTDDDWVGTVYWEALSPPAVPPTYPDDGGYAVLAQAWDGEGRTLDFGDADGDGINDGFAMPTGMTPAAVIYLGPLPSDGSAVRWDTAGWAGTVEYCWACGGQPQVSATGDFNGDGLADLLVGVSALDPNDCGDAGTWIYWGGEWDYPPEPSMFPNCTGGGGEVHGDLDGDGTDDLVYGSRIIDGSSLDGGGSPIGDYARATISTQSDSELKGGDIVGSAGDIDDDGVIDLVAQADDVAGDDSFHVLVYPANVSGTVGLAAASGGWVLADPSGNEITSGATRCHLPGSDAIALLLNVEQSWLIELPGSIPPVGTPLPERVLALEDAYAVACGDVTGSGYDDLVFAARSSVGEDVYPLHVLEDWTIPWDEDQYWP